MIDIIIPMYDCLDQIESALLSISSQILKDKLNVILVDDCSHQNYEKVINKFSPIINIKYIRHKKNKGAGASRQTGMDNSSSKYVIFMDSDDLFYTSTSTELLYKTINSGFDYVDSLVYNEKTNKNYSSVSDLHGKIYRRAFLKKHNIKFNNTRYHEDNSFNNIVLLNNPKIKSIDIQTYIYCYNNNSLTNLSREEEPKNLEFYIKNIKYVIDNTTNCSKEKVEKYINIKYEYLKNIINKYPSKNTIINNLLNKYELAPITK